MLVVALTAWGVPVHGVLASDPPKGKAGPPSLRPSALTGLSMSGDLLSVTISPDLNCAVDKQGDTDGEFYGDTACATLLASDGVLYGPAVIPAGDSASPRTAFTPVSQTLSGTGSDADSWRITTVVDAGTSLRITEVDSYVTGSLAYQTDITVSNLGDDGTVATLYRAGDCYLEDSDFGFGHLEAGSSVACIGASTDPADSETPGTWMEAWSPLSYGSAMYYGFYDDLWSAIGTQQMFANGGDSLDTYMDNAAGLSWSFVLDAGATTSRSSIVTFTDEHSCDAEDLSLGQVGDAGDPVIVRYDPRYLTDESQPTHLADAQALAERIQARAESTLHEYEHDLDSPCRTRSSSRSTARSAWRVSTFSMSRPKRNQST
ncbi:MAG TPA: hypothetical protein VFW92_08360 [Candidatus Limnocylindrales bacterium]|nr:hypothetical protein [Candidatus Limnocylindrales bacterium]